MKTLISTIGVATPTLDEVRLFASKIHGLAKRLGIDKLESVRNFISCVSALVMEIDSYDPIEVQWFGYHVGMLADELAQESMINFYHYLGWQPHGIVCY